MPLRATSDNPNSFQEIKENFVIFYSSVVDGKLWCPDCRAVDGLVQQTFAAADAPSALIVYVGDRPTWRSKSNVYRSGPWNVDSIPTIIRIRDEARLVDSEISGNLATLVQPS